MSGDSEYEPKDSRNVTGTASTPDGRWTNRDRLPPLANGEVEEPRDDIEDIDDEDEDDEPVEFEPDAALAERIRHRQAH